MKRALPVLMLAALLPACSFQGFVFRTDEAIDVVVPESRSTVDLPVTISWTDERPPAQPRVSLTDPTAEFYAVFIDRSPMRPGKGAISLIEDLDDQECKAKPGCPDPKLLSDQGVVLTAEPKITLEFLKDLRPNGAGDDPHEVTIVRMRGDMRVGEAAFTTPFFVRR